MTVNDHIRLARRDDAAAIARVHVTAWQDTYAGLLPDPYLIRMSEASTAARWRATLAWPARRGSTYVVDQPGRGVVGYGTCGPCRASPAVKAEGEIYELYVHPEAQGQGRGRALIARLAEHLLAGRKASACVRVLELNPGRWFYHALGGRLSAHEQIRFAGEWLTQVAYVWPDAAALGRLAQTSEPR